MRGANTDAMRPSVDGVYAVYREALDGDPRDERDEVTAPRAISPAKRRSARKGLVRRIWIPLVMILVVAVGTVTVVRLHGIFGSHQHVSDAGNLDAIVAFNPKRVVYEIFGPAGATATINYLDADAQPQEVDNAALPWSFRIETTMSSVVANVIAQGDGATLGCRIIVNDVVRDQLLVEAHNAATTCLVKSA